MDWDRYKQICDVPNVFSRWMLEQTRELTDPGEADVLGRALLNRPLSKPADHQGDALTDMFELELPLAQVRAIAACIEMAVAQGRFSSGTRQRGLGGFAEAWCEYAAYLEANQRDVS